MKMCLGGFGLVASLGDGAISSCVRAVCLGFALLGLSAGAAQAQVITEFGYGTTISTFASPGGITAGPDGNVWFAESAKPMLNSVTTPLGVIRRGLPTNPRAELFLWSLAVVFVAL